MKVKMALDEVQEAREELRKDYSDVVVDHYLNPRNLGRMENHDGYANVTSPCGDSMWLWLKVRYDSRTGKDVIQNATFICDICVGAVSAGSMLTELIEGKTIKKALAIKQDDSLRELGGLPEQFVHCAALAEDTLKAAIRYYADYAVAPWKRLYQRKY